MITGEKEEAECKWVKIFPGEPAEYLTSGCGHSKYVVTADFKIYKYCPYCGLKLKIGEDND